MRVRYAPPHAYPGTDIRVFRHEPARILARTCAYLVTDTRIRTRSCAYPGTEVRVCAYGCAVA
eukprot:2942570-Rhodomonas_salina.1